MTPPPPRDTPSIRLTRPQENALVAAVGFPEDSPAYGVIMRGGHRLVRALTEVGLMRLRQLGLVAEWRTDDQSPGSPVTSVKLNDDGIELAQAITRRCAGP